MGRQIASRTAEISVVLPPGFGLLRVISLPIGHSLTSRDVRNCSKAELSCCCGKFPTERVGVAPACALAGAVA
jgi:hypothetical protein